MAIEDDLRRLYYDPEVGYTSATRLLQVAKSRGIDVKLKQVRAFLAKQQVAQIHQTTHREREYLHIVSPNLDERWQADLIEFPKLSKDNNGHRYILTIVDVYSRYAWCIPLKDKQGKTVADALEELFQKGRRPLSSFTSDSGSEFANKHVKRLLKRYNVRQYTSQTGDHERLGMIERFNRTLKTYLARYFTATNATTWVNVLPSFVRNYNSQKHRMTGRAPKDVVKDSIANPTEQNLEAIGKFESFRIGDVVRVRLDSNIFTKGYVPRFTKKTYIVGGVQGYSYELYDMKGNRQQTLRKWYELQKVTDVQKAPTFARDQAALNATSLVLPRDERPRKRRKKTFGEDWVT